MQTLEGSRRCWVVSKRYTDFVKLHDALSPVFRIQIDPKSSISVTEKVLPILPTKISGQSEAALNQRMRELETYMSQVLNLLSGQVQFNQILLNFVGFAPYSQPTRGLSYADEASMGGKQAFIEGITPELFNIENFSLSAQTTFVRIGSHQIRLDQNQKPKNFYVIQIYFKDAAREKGKKAGRKDNAVAQDNQREGGPQVTINQIQLEKVYGDFKRLNEYIVETFQNEIKEYERFEQMMHSQGQFKIEDAAK